MRAAAVSSLSAFGAHCPSLRPRVLTLLRRALFDNDDEVGPGPPPPAMCAACCLRQDHTGAWALWACRPMHACVAACAGAWAASRACGQHTQRARAAQVRDRATLAITRLQGANGAEVPDPEPWKLSSRALESALQAYLADGPQSQPFDLVGPLWPPARCRAASRHAAQAVCAAILPPGLPLSAPQWPGWSVCRADRA